MSWFDMLYGGSGRGVDPHEPEKKGLRRFFQVLGRDFAQLMGANFLVCALVLPAALGVSLGIILLNFPLTLLGGLIGGMPAGLGLLLMADCCLRSLCNDPSPWLPRAGQTIAAKWKKALPLGSLVITLLGALSFVWAFMMEVMQSGQYPGSAVLVFLTFDLFALGVGASLCFALLAAAPPQEASLGEILRKAGHMLLLAPGRSFGGSAFLLAGTAVLILFFPVSTLWAMLFGFWLPVLAAMLTFFPVLQQFYDLTIRRPDPGEAEEMAPKEMNEKERRRHARANWWYYHWGLVATAAVLAAAVIYAVHGLTSAVDPDYSVAVVTTDTLPDASVLEIQQLLEGCGVDRNRDGLVVVNVNVYTWSANAELNDMSSQTAAATRMNTDLATGESGIWILADPAGFESAYGILSETFGEDWESRLCPWTDVPALAQADLGSYNTSADGSASQSVQELFADYQIAVLDGSDGLWDALLAAGQ